MSRFRSGVCTRRPPRLGCGPKHMTPRAPQVNMGCILTSCNLGVICFGPQPCLGIVAARPWSMSRFRSGVCTRRPPRAWLWAETYDTKGAPSQHGLHIDFTQPGCHMFRPTTTPRHRRGATLVDAGVDVGCVHPTTSKARLWAETYDTKGAPSQHGLHIDFTQPGCHMFRPTTMPRHRRGATLVDAGVDVWCVHPTTSKARLWAETYDTKGAPSQHGLHIDFMRPWCHMFRPTTTPRHRRGATLADVEV